MSWKPEVWVYNSRRWDGNSCRFATKDEAEAYVHDLAMRWTLVDRTRTIEVDEPVTCTFTNDKLTFLENEPCQ